VRLKKVATKLSAVASILSVVAWPLQAELALADQAVSPRAISQHQQPQQVHNPASAATNGSALSQQYPNLLAELGQTDEAIQRKIADAFAHFFYGDATTQALYFSDGQNSNGPKAFIQDINSNDVRSEGMSYGMMIALQLNKKAEFDALWNWAKTHMYQADPKHPAYGYFAWSMATDGSVLDVMPAPDGEEYFVTALYFASVRWGNGSGIYDYKTQADQLLHLMRHRQVITGPTITYAAVADSAVAGKGNHRQPIHKTQTGTNLFHPDHAMVRFTPDLENADHTDASYHVPAFYEIWARLGPAADRAFWRKAAAVSRDYFSLAAHPKTGLTPDYGNFDGSPWAASWRPESADFRFDAWRTAMNWAVDWSWWRLNPRAQELSQRLQTFFLAEGLDRYASQYSLDGKKLDEKQTTGLVAMNAVASLASTHPDRLLFVEALWQQPLPTGQYRYYDGMLYLLALLHVSGQFQAWLPEANTGQP